MQEALDYVETVKGISTDMEAYIFNAYVNASMQFDIDESLIEIANIIKSK